MKRKTKNTCLLSVIGILNKEIDQLKRTVSALVIREQKRDAAWDSHSDQRIREINAAIRSTNKKEMNIMLL